MLLRRFPELASAVPATDVGRRSSFRSREITALPVILGRTGGDVGPPAASRWGSRRLADGGPGSTPGTRRALGGVPRAGERESPGPAARHGARTLALNPDTLHNGPGRTLVPAGNAPHTRVGTVLPERSIAFRTGTREMRMIPRTKKIIRDRMAYRNEPVAWPIPA